MTTETPEGTRRLRALVRAGLSPAVWMVLAVQFSYPLLRQAGFFGAEDIPSLLRTLVLAAIVSAVLFLQAGVLAGLTASRNALGARAAVTAALQVFPRFLWLMVKAGAVFGLVLGGALSVLLVASGATPQAMFEQIALPMALAFAVLPAVFVWWLPAVFVEREFGLVASVQRALRALVAAPLRSVFPVALVLVPGLLLLLLAADSSPALLLPIQAANMFLMWVADVYCIEWLQDSRA